MAAANTQFTIAVHILAALGNCSGASSTSAQLAASVNTTPSFVRRILAMLAKANLITTTRGPSGCCSLAKNPRDISLLDIYKAVDAPAVFALHTYSSKKSCAVSCGIKSAMREVLGDAQYMMEKSLKNRSLADIIQDVR
jgi:Rrf2 family protein